MARKRPHTVTVLMTKRIRLDRTFWAESEDEAGDEAAEMVAGWQDVESAEAISVEEDG